MAVQLIATGSSIARPHRGVHTPPYQRALPGPTQGKSRLACPCGLAFGQHTIARPTHGAGLIYWPLTWPWPLCSHLAHLWATFDSAPPPPPRSKAVGTPPAAGFAHLWATSWWGNPLQAPRVLGGARGLLCHVWPPSVGGGGGGVNLMDADVNERSVGGRSDGGRSDGVH